MTSKHDKHGLYTNYEETPDELILDGTKISWHQERIKKWEKGERIAPITIDLALTRSCNYGCHFCYAMVQENDRSTITKEHIDSFLEDAAEIGVKGISLISDGESTVSPLYTHSIVKGGTLGISMASGTNGFLLTPEKLNKILPHLTYLRFNISAGGEPSWRDNFFEGIPSPAGGILVLMPLIYSKSELQIINLDYSYFVPALFILISILLISKLPTYSFKKIAVPRRLTIFLLFAVVLFFGMLLIYTHNVIVISSLLYLTLIPFSIYHFHKLNKKFKNENIDNEEHEDVL